ncbi:MAG: hypothetical protein QF383_06220, partial [Flavobacteriales bacterium]|nr:hypothetical protein [Flavobacteriales bacterium]
MKKLLLFTLTSILLFACKHELEKPTWDVDMIVPIAHSEMDINNLLTDSNASAIIDDNNFITLIYEQNFIDMNYDSLIKIDEEFGEKTTTLDSVIFDVVVIADTASVGDAIAQIPGGTIFFPDGSTNTIPAMPNMMSNDTIGINTSEYFETMTLHKGWLIIDLINNFPTDVSNVSMTLINSVNQDIIANFNFPLIPSGTTSTDSVDISGKVLDQSLIAIVNNMDVEESNGPVLIKYSDAIITKITLTDIGIIEATAIFPEQELDSKKEEHIFDMKGAQITEIGVKEGTVTLNVLSTLPNGRIIYSIPSLSKNGVPFYTENVIPTSQNGELTSFEFDFAGYVLDLTGKEDRDGGDTINTIYTETFSFIDSTGELITLNHTDSFYSNTEFLFIPEYALGYLGQDTIEIEENEINFEVMNNINVGNIDLEEVKLKLKVENYIGADAYLEIIKLRSENLGGESIDLFENYIVDIERATLTNESTPINSTLSETIVDADEFIEILPNKITSQANFYLNPNGQSATQDFLYPEYPLEASLSIEIPLSFIATNLTFIDTNEVNIKDESEYDIEKIYITMENGLPFTASIELILLDENNIVIDTLLQNSTIISAQIDANNIVTKNTISTLEMDYPDFESVKKIVSVSSFSTEPNNEFIDIYSNYKLDIT